MNIVGRRPERLLLIAVMAAVNVSPASSCTLCVCVFSVIFLPVHRFLIPCHTVSLSSPACHPGFYKAYAGNIKCSKCPPHSFSYGEGAAICRCEKGFFRAEKDPPTMACTREYGSKQGSLINHIDVHGLHPMWVSYCFISGAGGLLQPSLRIRHDFKPRLVSRTYLVRNCTLESLWMNYTAFVQLPRPHWWFTDCHYDFIFALNYSLTGLILL